MSLSPGWDPVVGTHGVMVAVVLHWLGRGVRRDKWINHSLLVSLVVWQIPGVPGAGCSLQEFCAVEAALGPFPLQEKQELLPLVFLGRQLCTVKAFVVLGPTSHCLGFQTLFSSSENGWMLGVLLWPGAF